MEKRRVITWLVAIALSGTLVMGGCGGSSSEFSDDFTTPTLIDNAYLPLAPGTTYIYEGETDEGTETIEVTWRGLNRGRRVPRYPRFGSKTACATSGTHTAVKLLRRE